jgi:hypothetical protein
MCKNKSPLREIWGKWPGNEPIEDILEALRGDDMDRRDDNAMATGCYPPKRSIWRYAWRITIILAGIISFFLALVGAHTVGGW